MQLFDQNANYADPTARHHFAIMAGWTLFKVGRFLDHEEKIDDLLQKMTEAARISLDNSYLNCGCYYDLPWIKSFASLDHLRNFQQQSLSSLFDLLNQFKFVNTSSSSPLEYSDLLDESGKVVAVITGERVKEDYEKVKVKIRECLDTDDRGLATKSSAFFSQTGSGSRTDELPRSDGNAGEGVMVMADCCGHSDDPPSYDGPSEGIDQDQGEVDALSSNSDAIILPSEPAHEGMSTNIMATMTTDTGQTQAIASCGEFVPVNILPQDDNSPITRSTHPPASTDNRAFHPTSPLSGSFEGTELVSAVRSEQIGINSEGRNEGGIERGLGRDSNGSQIEMQEVSSHWGRGKA